MRKKLHLSIPLALIAGLLFMSSAFSMAEETAPPVVSEASADPEPVPAAPEETPAPQPVETNAPQPAETSTPETQETTQAPPQNTTVEPTISEPESTLSPAPPTEENETIPPESAETVQPPSDETPSELPDSSSAVFEDTTSAVEPEPVTGESTFEPETELPAPETESMEEETVEETSESAEQTAPESPTTPAPRPAAPVPAPAPVVVATKPAVRLTLYPAECTLQVAGTCTLSWELSDGSIPASVPVFSTSNASVATVSRDGIITAVSPGSAVITAVYNGQSDSCKVTVNAEPAFTLSAKTDAGEVISSLIGSGYVLFLPDTASLEDLVLTSSKRFSSANGAKLSPDGKSLSGSFKNGDSFTVTLPDTDVTQSITVLASDLPALNLSLKDTTLDEVQKDKNIKYKGNALILNDPSVEEYCLSASDVEFKGRGNSSWRDFEKKGYQIRFSEKTSVLGMPEAKKWCLVPNAGDSSMMRNILAYQLAASGDLLWTPKCASINLWIDGVYQGLYLITEKVEIGKNRLPLTEDDSILVEMDNAFYTDEDLWYCSDITGMYYVCKDAVDEDLQTDAFEEFQKNMTAFEQALNEGATCEVLSSYIDMESFAEFYLVNELADNREVLCTSCYFYTRNGKIYAGPVWDFDSALGTDPQVAGTNYLITHGSNGSYQTNLFRLLAGVPEFADLVYELYEQVYADAFNALPETVEKLEEDFSAAAKMNNVRWRSALGAATSKGNIVASSFSEGVKELRDWLDKRIRIFIPLDQFLKVEGSSHLQTFSFSDEQHAYTSIRAAIWDIEKGPDSRTWFTLTDFDTSWNRILDLGTDADGTYTVHLYGTDSDVYTLIGHLDFTVRAKNKTLTAQVPSFGDTKDTLAFYYKPLTWAVQNEVLEDSHSDFNPSQECSRADAILWLWRASGSPRPCHTGVFTDLSDESELDLAASWALENGLYEGESSDRFVPSNHFTRGEFISILYHCAVRSLYLSDQEHPFREKDAVAWAIEEKLASVATAAEFDASAACTRAQVITFLYRFFNN